MGSSSTRISASAASARAMATSDFSVRVRSWTRTSGSISAPTTSSACSVRARSVPVNHAEAPRKAEHEGDVFSNGHPLDEPKILVQECDREVTGWVTSRPR